MSTQTVSKQQRSDRPLLDVFQALFLSAGHPGVKTVEPYGPGVGGIEGVKVRFEWGANDYFWAYLFVDGDGRDATPKPFAPDVPYADVPDSKGGTVRKWLVADYVLKLAHDVCETARPDAFTGWAPAAVPGVGLGDRPSALCVAPAEGAARMVRVTIGSGNTKDPAEDPWTDYVISA